MLHLLEENGTVAVSEPKANVRKPVTRVDSRREIAPPRGTKQKVLKLKPHCEELLGRPATQEPANSETAETTHTKAKTEKNY